MPALDRSEFEKKIIFEHTVPAKKARFAEFPQGLSPELRGYLVKSGVEKLYSHQAEMFDRAKNGENVVITTSTASGKTLSFLLPIVEDILKDPLTRAIFIYPTKALASDQFRALKPLLDYFGPQRIRAGVYDGDTPPGERSRLRSGANILLTNPEMLSSAFLPNHANFGFNFIFSNLKYIVVDELHTYRGAFGSHLANVFKRLSRVCRYYNSAPLFLCSSATIANPLELASAVCGRPFSLVDEDGSPSPEKHFYLWQPPTVRGTDYRLSPAREAAEFIPRLVDEGSSFIAFCKSRNAVEVVLKESRDRLGGEGKFRDDSGLVAGYRGGYKPLERKEIEKKMAGGLLRGLVATNVLELGIDIGRLDTAVLVGFPGTRASFWQQAGRAGRKGEASVYLMLDNLPLDQYLAVDPEWLFSSGSENAVVDPDNLFIQLAHVRAAAAELPLSPDDLALFPDLGEVVPVLADAGELRKENGKFAFSGGAFPAGDISLRNMDKVRFKLKNAADGSVLTEMDELQAYREIYRGAIYLHEGREYLVESLDTENGLAAARPIDVNYYTVSCDTTRVEKLRTFKSAELGRARRAFGDVRVSYTTFGFRRLQFHNHQNLGYEKLDRPLSKGFDTEGLLLALPPEVSRLFLKLDPPKEGGFSYWKTYAEGLCFAVLNAAMMVTMTTPDDIGAALLGEEGEAGPNLSVCIFDMYSGGLGFAAKAYEKAAEIVKSAARMIEGCSCEDGCAACVGDYRLDKRVVLWGLKSLFAALPAPDGIRVKKLPQSVPEEKRFTLNELPERWEEFRELMGKSGEYLGRFLSQVPAARTEGSRLILAVDGRFMRDWLCEKENREGLEGLVKRYVSVPRGFEVAAEGGPGAPADPKLKKLFNELTR